MRLSIWRQKLENRAPAGGEKGSHSPGDDRKRLLQPPSYGCKRPEALHEPSSGLTAEETWLPKPKRGVSSQHSRAERETSVPPSQQGSRNVYQHHFWECGQASQGQSQEEILSLLFQGCCSVLSGRSSLGHSDYSSILFQRLAVCTCTDPLPDRSQPWGKQEKPYPQVAAVLECVRLSARSP